MEGKRRSVKRTLHRKHVVSRLEQDLWAFVYEHFWPWTVPKAAPRARPVRVCVQPLHRHSLAEPEFMEETGRIALYARVSSQRQAEEATIQSQVAALKDRIAADGGTLDDELLFLDDGYSGASLQRWNRTTLRGILINPAYYGEAHWGKTRVAERPAGHRPHRGEPQTPRREKSARLRLLRLGLHWAGPSSARQSTCLLPLPGNRQIPTRRRSALSEPRRRHRSGGDDLERCPPPADRSRSPSRRTATPSAGNARQGRRSRLAAHVDRRFETPIGSTARMYETGFLDKDEFAARAQCVKDRLSREERAYAEQRQANAQAQENQALLTDFAQIASQLQARIDQADFASKRTVLTVLIKRIEIEAEQFHIVYKVQPRPFAPSPSGGCLQHRLKFQASASRLTSLFLIGLLHARSRLYPRQSRGREGQLQEP
jgi:Recombinase